MRAPTGPAGLLLALALSLGLAACAAPETYRADTAQLLQAGVLTVSEAAASGDADAALTRLAELEAALLDAHAQGEVDDARFESISAAIALVRADLDALVAAEQTTDSGPGKPDKPKPGKPEKPGKD